MTPTRFQAETAELITTDAGDHHRDRRRGSRCLGLVKIAGVSVICLCTGGGDGEPNNRNEMRRHIGGNRI